MGTQGLWRAIPTVELVLATIVIVMDLFVPTLILLGFCALSLLARRQGPSAIGFVKLERPIRTALLILLVVIAWSVLQLGVAIRS
jgi:hypothetical protein